MSTALATDERVRAAIENWAPRFVANGVNMIDDGNHVCNDVTYKYRPQQADWMQRRLEFQVPGGVGADRTCPGRLGRGM